MTSSSPPPAPFVPPVRSDARAAGGRLAGPRRAPRPLTRARLLRAALAAIGLSGAWASGACSASDCRVGYESNPLVPFRGGARYAADGAPTDELAGGLRPPVYYETAAPDGEHLDFNGGARYCIYHGLGYRPFRVEPWVSFSATGTNSGNEAKPAGNMLEVLHVDACVIIMRNDSCGEYFLRVTASDPVLSEPGALPAACDGAGGDPCLDPDDSETLAPAGPPACPRAGGASEARRRPARRLPAAPQRARRRRRWRG